MNYVWCLSDIGDCESNGIYEIYSSFEKAQEAFIKNVVCPTTIRQAVETYGSSFQLVNDDDVILDFLDYSPDTEIIHAYSSWGTDGHVEVFELLDVDSLNEFCGIEIVKMPLL